MSTGLENYQKNLAALVLLCGVGLSWQPPPRGRVVVVEGKDKTQHYSVQFVSQWSFYVVYALVMGADWLQGPFLYSLYRDEYGVPPNTISALFTTGFLSGAASAYVVGFLADRYGRRLVCLLFCLSYSASCLLTMQPSLPLLYAGRTLGGLSTSILFSIFESWMMTDFNRKFLGEKGLDLSQTFGNMNTLNSIAAIAAGLGSEAMVKYFETMKAPFVASIALLGAAFICILTQWDENYGGKAEEPKGDKKSKDEKDQPSLLKTLLSKDILTLGLASTLFEGSMYLFVFFWAPALRAAQTTTGDLPYGIIFASLMASMMLGSLGFTFVVSRGWATQKQLFIGLMATACGCFFALSTPKPEMATFWLFCAFEACVGLYWPSVGFLKGQMVDDSVRAKVYGALRIPLNVFVVVSLVLSEGGEAGKVFSICSMLMLGASTALVATSLTA